MPVAHGFDVAQRSVEEGLQVVLIATGRYRLHHLIEIQVAEELGLFQLVDLDAAPRLVEEDAVESSCPDQPESRSGSGAGRAPRSLPRVKDPRSLVIRLLPLTCPCAAPRGSRRSHQRRETRFRRASSPQPMLAQEATDGWHRTGGYPSDVDPASRSMMRRAASERAVPGRSPTTRARSPSARRERRCVAMRTRKRRPIRGESDRHAEMRPADPGRQLIGGEPLGLGEHVEEHPQHRSRPTFHRRTYGARRRTPRPRLPRTSPEAASAILARSRAPAAPRSPPRRSNTPAQWTAQSPRASTILVIVSSSRMFVVASHERTARSVSPASRQTGHPALRSARPSSASRRSSRRGFRFVTCAGSPSVLDLPVGTGLRGWSAPAALRRSPAARSPNPVTRPGPRTPFLRAP